MNGMKKEVFGVRDDGLVEGWGMGVIPLLARDFHNGLPDAKGCSGSNIQRMVQFARGIS